MKAALFLLLALGAASASACDYYAYCHCHDSDGVANNGATDDICNYFVGTQSYDGDIQGNECLTGSGPDNSFWNNCKWRIYCKIVGATGSDSSCRAKAGS
jgi:hypothetical protein